MNGRVAFLFALVAPGVFGQAADLGDLSAATDPAAGVEKEALLVSPYRIQAVRSLIGPPGFQAAYSRARYLVNFGKREGVKVGSVFEVATNGAVVGMVRVEETWRDTTHVRPVRLHNKLELDDPYPFRRGYHLFPFYVMLETVRFKKGKPVFNAEMHERLHYVARFINSFPDLPVVLEGHTDNTGDLAKNLSLSQRRAQGIRTYLNEIHFIPLDQMYVKGYGETDPMANNNTEDGRRQNRRVDIVMMGTFPE